MSLGLQQALQIFLSAEWWHKWRRPGTEVNLAEAPRSGISHVQGMMTYSASERFAVMKKKWPWTLVMTIHPGVTTLVQQWESVSCNFYQPEIHGSLLQKFERDRSANFKVVPDLSPGSGFSEHLHIHTCKNTVSEKWNLAISKRPCFWDKQHEWTHRENSMRPSQMCPSLYKVSIGILESFPHCKCFRIT